MPDPIKQAGAIRWLDDIAPDQAVGVLRRQDGADGRAYRAGVNGPWFTVTVEALNRRHWGRRDGRGG